MPPITRIYIQTLRHQSSPGLVHTSNSSDWSLTDDWCVDTRWSTHHLSLIHGHAAASSVQVLCQRNGTETSWYLGLCPIPIPLPGSFPCWSRCLPFRKDQVLPLGLLYRPPNSTHDNTSLTTPTNWWLCIYLNEEERSVAMGTDDGPWSLENDKTFVYLFFLHTLVHIWHSSEL